MNFSRFLHARLGGATIESAMNQQVYWKGGDKQESTSTSKPYQQKQYNTLLGGADKWLNSGGLDQYYGGSQDFDPVADMNQNQQQGISGLAGSGAQLNQLYSGQGLQSLSRYFGEYDPNKTGLAAAQSAAAEQAQFDFETGQVGNIRQGANQAGQYGSTRAGIAEGLARGRLAQGIAANNAQMAYQDQQAYNQNQLATLNNLSAITKGLSSGSAMQYDAGTLSQQQQQREIMGQLDKWAYENNVSLNNLLAYKQLISGDMGGTVKSESKGGGSGFGSALGSLGGMAAGSYFGGNTQMGGQIGGLIGGMF